MKVLTLSLGKLLSAINPIKLFTGNKEELVITNDNGYIDNSLTIPNLSSLETNKLIQWNSNFNTVPFVVLNEQNQIRIEGDINKSDAVLATNSINPTGDHYYCYYQGAVRGAIYHIVDGTTNNIGFALLNEANGVNFNTINGITNTSLGYQINGSFLNLNDLADVEITDPQPGECLVYDGSNWVNGVSPFTWVYSVAINNSNVSNQTLRRQNGTVTSDCNYVMGYSAVIEKITMENRNDDNDDWDLLIYVNGSQIASFYKPQNITTKVFDKSEINIELNQGDEFYLICDNRDKGNISHPGASLYFRER